MPKVPRYTGLKPASERASAAAKGASRKQNTRCEVLLRKALFKLGLRFRVNAATLPGRPDVVLMGARVAVFVDGDFWHGRNLEARIAKLQTGHNAPYWIEKIRANVARDGRHDEALRAAGWRVMRLWETDILREPAVAAELIAAEVARLRAG